MYNFKKNAAFPSPLIKFELACLNITVEEHGICGSTAAAAAEMAGSVSSADTIHGNKEIFDRVSI